MTMKTGKFVQCRRGASLMYLLVLLIALTMFASLSVDVARVQLAKTQVRTAVDSAARYAAMGLDRDASTAVANAVDAASLVNVDGKPLALVPAEDVFLGTWDDAARTFTATNDYTTANAVQVIGRRVARRNTAVPLMFASILGMNSCDIKGDSAIAKLYPSVNVNQNVPATANPFLSGMPYGSVASQINPHHNPDYAGNSSDPRQSPLQVGLAVSSSTPYTFDSIDGDARHDPNLDYFSPDGDLGDIGHNNLTTNGSNSYGATMYPQNGMTDIKAPINALVGVFLSDEAPNKTAVPTLNADDLAKAPQDFSTSAARNMTSYQPKLKQLFFIGDGKTDNGVTQQFVAPPGATRLFLATWDFYEWNNNAGQRNIRVARPATVQLVK
jgi:Flp pilus assembly protein TadG